MNSSINSKEQKKIWVGRSTCSILNRKDKNLNNSGKYLSKRLKNFPESRKFSSWVRLNGYFLIQDNTITSTRSYFFLLREVNVWQKSRFLGSTNCYSFDLYCFYCSLYLFLSSEIFLKIPSNNVTLM